MLFLPTKQADFFLSLMAQSISKTEWIRRCLYIADRSFNWYSLNGEQFGNIKNYKSLCPLVKQLCFGESIGM